MAMQKKKKVAARKVKTITTDFRPERSFSSAIPCPKCNSYCERNDWTFTKSEIDGPMNCGRSWGCCLAGFKCPKCKVRILARQQAPECG